MRREDSVLSYRARTLSVWTLPFVVALFFVTLLPLPAASQGVTQSVGVIQHTLAITPSTFPISHIVYVIMENHAYDNYYGVYCERVSSNCPVAGNGIPPRTCVNETPGSS